MRCEKQLLFCEPIGSSQSFSNFIFSEGNLETIVELKNIVNQLMQKNQVKSSVGYSSSSESRYEENQTEEVILY